MVMYHGEDSFVEALRNRTLVRRDCIQRLSDMDIESTVFVVDGDGERESVIALVTHKGLRAEGFSSVDDFLAHHDTTRKGCIVADLGMAGMAGLDLLRKLKARKSALPVVVITGYADVAMAVRAMQEGAVTF